MMMLMNVEKQIKTQKTKTRLRNIPDPEKILNIAYELMSNHGYSGTSISMICEQSGFAPSSIYWHFGNKKNLLLAALEFGIKKTLGPLDAKNLNLNDLDSEIMIADVDFFSEPPLIYRMMFMIGLENNGQDPELADMIRKVRAYARTIMKTQIQHFAEQKNKSVTLEIQDAIADMVLIMADGIILSTQLEPGKLDIKLITHMLNSTIKALIDQYG